MDGLWHYDDAGRPVGPVPAAHLRTLVLGGTLDGDTPVRRDGEETWMALRESALAPLLREPDAVVTAAGPAATGGAALGSLDTGAPAGTPAGAPVRSFGEAVRSCLRRYATFDGRAGRPEYWWFFLFAMLVFFALSIVDGAVLGTGPGQIPVLGTLAQLALFLPSLAVSVRRLHDRDMVGWWVLLGLIPIFGFFALLVLMTLPGTPGPNRFGAAPAGPA